MLKVFGSLCYATTGPKQKFDSRSRKGVFLGYQFGTKGYIILDLQNKDIFVSRDVIFYESHFPFNNKLEAQEKEKLFPPQTKTFHDIDPLQLTPHHNNFTPQDQHPSQTPILPQTLSSPTTSSSPQISPSTSPSQSISPHISSSPHPNPIPFIPRRTTRSSKPNV